MLNTLEIDAVAENDLDTETIRDTLIRFGRGLSAAVKTKEVRDYIGLREQHNFAGVYKRKRECYIVVIAESLPLYLREICKIVPNTHKWTLNAKFAVRTTDDLEHAKQMLELSRLYRASVAKIYRNPL